MLGPTSGNTGSAFLSLGKDSTGRKNIPGQALARCSRPPAHGRSAERIGWISLIRKCLGLWAYRFGYLSCRPPLLLS